MTVENDKLRRMHEESPRVDPGENIGDIAKRLRKREHECQALWESLRDLKAKVDENSIMQILAKRHLDSKGIRKLA